ncbi:MULTISPECIES: DUF6957 family protein [Pseudomonas]|uniref:DUF6957 family protein n=1 Tax=Pseudomonas TaxID=286 RepID=UPI00070E3AAC|nr:MULTISPECIES: hypothetical protein [Pseudomonas]
MHSDLDELGELLYGSAEVMPGADLSDVELIEFAASRYVNKPYCVVRQWMIIDVLMSAKKTHEIEQLGMHPSVLYAANIIHDSRGRFSAGNWVLSTYKVSFRNCFFETRNTLYILAGRGFRKSASLDAVLSLRRDAVGLV